MQNHVKNNFFNKKLRKKCFLKEKKHKKHFLEEILQKRDKQQAKRQLQLLKERKRPNESSSLSTAPTLAGAFPLNSIFSQRKNKKVEKKFFQQKSWKRWSTKKVLQRGILGKNFGRSGEFFFLFWYLYEKIFDEKSFWHQKKKAGELCVKFTDTVY